MNLPFLEEYCSKSRHLLWNSYVLLRQVLLTVPPTRSSMTFDIFYTIFVCFLVCFVRFFNSKSHLVCLQCTSHPKFTHISYRSESSSNKICRKQVSVKHKQENEIFLQFLKWIWGVLLSEISFAKRSTLALVSYGLQETVWQHGADVLPLLQQCKISTSPLAHTRSPYLPPHPHFDWKSEAIRHHAI